MTWNSLLTVSGPQESHRRESVSRLTIPSLDVQLHESGIATVLYNDGLAAHGSSVLLVTMASITAEATSVFSLGSQCLCALFYRALFNFFRLRA